ncbi:hypothetical protein [Brevibacillus sp. SYSU BS000544]|uniref:hypothetical protein n=1 Tax=Brevibacillus sp. SYSU BS000544 TaxID=3416443 RepID=UPI003CE4D8F2
MSGSVVSRRGLHGKVAVQKKQQYGKHESNERIAVLQPITMVFIQTNQLLKEKWIPVIVSLPKKGLPTLL